MASLINASKELVRPSGRTVFRTSRRFSKSTVFAKQTYPLYPSVAQLLHEKGIPSSEVDKIPASGPKGRLLKGDVLAYLGSISSSYSSDQSARISKLAHLDLSKIQIAAPKDPKESPVSAVLPHLTQETPAILPDTEVAVSISFKAVHEVQQRIRAALGVTLPLSTFITRATLIANEDLPRPTTHKPSANELFNQVLGLDRVDSKTSRGSFTPQILALPSTPPSSTSGLAKKRDIIDILAAGHSSKDPSKNLKTPLSGVIAQSDEGATTNVFSVSVPTGQEKRARVFLERVKTILQVEPETLVL
ncbi:pyridoxine biosynthesis protein [Pseudocyphellaria aurata]|nr:pyridoxine biosynthesis protein [Pseudocyphellaria aurata]